jgi:hypothetical protein
MLAVLVFMGLTRGSRGESIVITGQNSMREWGKRHLSLSGDWTTRFRRKSSVSRPSGRSRPPTTPSKSEIPLPGELTACHVQSPSIDFPTQSMARLSFQRERRALSHLSISTPSRPMRPLASRNSLVLAQELHPSEAPVNASNQRLITDQLPLHLSGLNYALS